MIRAWLGSVMGSDVDGSLLAGRSLQRRPIPFLEFQAKVLRVLAKTVKPLYKIRIVDCTGRIFVESLWVIEADLIRELRSLGGVKEVSSYATYYYELIQPGTGHGSED